MVEKRINQVPVSQRGDNARQDPPNTTERKSCGSAQPQGSTKNPHKLPFYESMLCLLIKTLLMMIFFYFTSQQFFIYIEMMEGWLMNGAVQ